MQPLSGCSKNRLRAPGRSSCSASASHARRKSRDLTFPRAGAEPAYQHVVPDASARLCGGPGRDRPPLCGGAEPVLPAAEAKLP